tara:strand:+ start:1043 stop:1723 length:681 start_codon:yes stop_codon:yes gene_type:complete
MARTTQISGNATAAAPGDPKKLKSFPLAKKGEKATKRSMINFQNAGNQTRRAMGILWSHSANCPMFMQKKIQKKDADGKLIAFPLDKNKKQITQRSNRALTGHTLKSLASGAAATVGAQLYADTLTLGCSAREELPKFPMLPSFSAGAAMQFEAAYIAYVQEFFSIAMHIKNAIGKHQKVTPKVCHAAGDILNGRIAAATSFMPASITPRKVKRGSTKRKASAERV